MKSLPLFLLAALAQPALALVDTEGVDFFERKIRPVLTEKCYKCHSAASDKIKGGLVLDTREGIRRGGDNGPAVVPRSLDDSLLIEAVRYANHDFAMPPSKSGGKLPDEVIHDLEKWVAMGAPDPREGVAKPVATKQETWEKARGWWAWQSPKRAPAPEVKDAGWASSEIDRFLLAGLEAKGLHPAADADKLTLLRRVCFDLTGLPPTPQEINAFATDNSPEAYTRVVDRLLASPQYGERWGRHWLDVARYAESSGKDANIAFPNAWRYRDYVIAAFNQDKAFDQFIREQLAGDLLPAKNDAQRADQLVATGFLAIGAKGLNEQNPRQYALDLADEQIDATSQAFLGLTVACARCHDHKFDPIPQKDYYSLAGIFLSTDTRYGTARSIQDRHATELLELPPGAYAATVTHAITPADRAAKEQREAELKKELGEQIAARRSAGPSGQQDIPKFLRTVTQFGALEAELKNFKADGSPKALAMGVQDYPARSGGGFFGGGRFGMGMGMGGGLGGRYGQGRPPEFSSVSDAAVYARGEADKPGEKTPRGVLTLLAPAAETIPAGSSGRLQLADWIAAPANPLTSRVLVNRVWHWIFGAGIVPSTDNFGTTGAAPSDQALLDALAVHFAGSGWSVKKLVREIVLSHAYRISSAYEEKSFAADPENALHWRMSKRRLEAECIRDAVLSASGRLNNQPPLGSLIAQAGDGPIGGRRYTGISEEAIVDSGTKLEVRSVYLPIARDLLPDSLAVFDFSEPSLVSGNRESTNVPAQALYLLNSPFLAQSAQKLAERVMATYPAGPNGAATANLDQRATLAYWLVYSRGPTAPERKAAYDFFTRFPATWKPGDMRVSTLRTGDATLAAWTSFCRALFASSEFRYLN